MGLGVIRYKIWYDLWENKGRTLRVVAIIAIGLTLITTFPWWCFTDAAPTISAAVSDVGIVGICVPVNGIQLIVIVSIWVWVWWILVIHATKQRGVIEVFVLVGQAYVVAQFLASDTLLPHWIVVESHREISVIQFRITFCDMAV